MVNQIADNSPVLHNPLVSIIIPVYNSENYIADTIKSCLNQSYTNIELILINDGSTDRSHDIINQFLDDQRIQYFPIDNVGACEARNIGIGAAKGDLYQFLDHDDVIDVHKISYQIAAFNNHDDSFILSASMGSISGMDRTLDKGYEIYHKDFTPQEYFDTLLNQFGKHITTGAWLIPEKIVKSTHGWDAKSGLNDDGEYFMRLILQAKGIIYCKDSIFYFRRDVPNSLSKQFGSKEVYVKWLYSYTSYMKNFLKSLPPEKAKELGWKALSVFYCNTYPKYPDLLNECLIHMKSLGYNKPHPYGGDLFVLISKFIGVNMAIRVLDFKNNTLKKLKK
jgi:glycosyltransferase involved in cell wall biosynthesis